jgi:hypothetical protein
MTRKELLRPYAVSLDLSVTVVVLYAAVSVLLNGTGRVKSTPVSLSGGSRSPVILTEFFVFLPVPQRKFPITPKIWSPPATSSFLIIYYFVLF